MQVQEALNEYISYASKMPECLGRDVLHAAASKGHLELVEKMVKENILFGMDPNPRDDSKLTPLHLACQEGHLAVVKFLLPFLSDKNPKSGPEWEEKTPLHDAAYAGHLSVVEHLVENIEGDINPPKDNGITVFHVAAEGGSLNVVSFYAKKLSNPNPPMTSDDFCNGRTPLHMAAQWGQLSIVQYLCSLLVDKNPKDAANYTPLHLAASYGHAEIVKFFWKFVTDKNPRAEGMWMGRTPLWNAAINGHLHIIKLLEEHVKGDDINPKLGDGDNALNSAAMKGHLDIVSYYTKKLSNPNPEQPSHCGSAATPLHSAAQFGQLKVVKHICNLLVDKNPKDKVGTTPLHLAALHGHLDIVKYLVQFVKDKHPKSFGQKTPMDLARAKGHSEIVAFFQQLKGIAASKERKATKANKHVKASTVTRGNADEYDIEHVLQFLGIDEVNKGASKKKPKKKAKKNPQGKKASETEQSSGNSAPLQEVKDEECTICYEPRNPTYMFYPCGHATFCKDCATHLFENSEKKCPDCRRPIKEVVRVFQ